MIRTITIAAALTLCACRPEDKDNTRAQAQAFAEAHHLEAPRAEAIARLKTTARKGQATIAKIRDTGAREQAERVWNEEIKKLAQTMAVHGEGDAIAAFANEEGVEQ